MQRAVNHVCALLIGLQATVFAAACSTSASPAAAGGAGGAGGEVVHGEGGTDGRGGTGGAGGIGAGGTGGKGTNDLSWIFDETIWTPLPNQDAWNDDCRFLAADPSRISFPPLRWESCGEGCERADVKQAYATVAAEAALGISLVEGAATPYFRYNSGFIEEPPTSPFAPSRLRGFHRIVDLMTGRTTAVVQQVHKNLESSMSRCGGSVFVSSGVEMAGYRALVDSPGVLLRGTWQRDDEAWIWQLPWPTPDDMGFNLSYCNLISMEDGGRTFWLCGALVHAAITPGSSEYILLDRPGDAGFAVTQGDALGDFAVWAELSRGGTGSRVRGWRPDGNGVRTILDEIPVDTCAVGLSPRHVTGFSAAGRCVYFNHEGRLWIADRQNDDSLVNFRLGPIFSQDRVAVPEPVKIWGDYVALVWGPEEYDTRDDRRQLLLARHTDWAMRNLKAPRGYEVYVATLTDDHLYVVFSVASNGFGRFSHVYRYDLAKFDLIGEPVTPVEVPTEPSTP